MSNLRWKIAQWAERIWWHRYLKNKSVDEYLSWKKNYWQNFLKQLSLNEEKINQQKSIDLGCGPAGIFILFSNCTAVDPLLKKYNEDLAHFSMANYSNNQFIASCIEVFTPKETYDTICLRQYY